ncbi:MAG: hypothetical protein IPL28_03165 [Chloroflexi bacterium]|nr:hypothetical protein [Chloroflexota bacterium]
MAVRVELPLRRLRLVQHPRPALGAVGVGVRGVVGGTALAVFGRGQRSGGAEETEA